MDKKVTVLVAVGCSGKQEAVAVTVPVAVLVAVILSGGQRQVGWSLVIGEGEDRLKSYSVNGWLVVSHWGGKTDQKVTGPMVDWP